MIEFLSVVFGVHIAFLVYLSAYLTVRGITSGSILSVITLAIKYFVYSQLIRIGFAHFNTIQIIIGFTAGIYLGLILLYYYNKHSFAGANSSS